MLKPTYLAVIVTGAILVLAVLLNPSPEQHRAKIKQVIAERSQIEGVLGIDQLTAFVSKYKSLGVASYTTVDDKVKSIGVLGMVFIKE